ncbi:P-loop containing nucleoside triphosphate hydrolase protein [Mycena amicta]|nr:P-loop containing nucleoside triphosphate hydrolase protein [Mycena amicta]
MTTLHTFQTEMDEIAKQRAGIARLRTTPGGNALLEIEEKFIKAVLSNASDARDLAASLITQHFGEYILRIGLQPPQAKLFAGELSDDSDGGWTGISRTEAEIEVLKEKIRAVVEDVGGKTSVLFQTSSGTRHRASLLLRLPPLSVSQTPEVRCCCVGNVDAGVLDDGRGRARVGLFRHKHEVETGRTSSIGMEILGFGPSGNAILPPTAHSTDLDVIRREKLGWEEISIQASKIVSFSDLAGHERYLKTTLYGLTSGAPSCVILIVGGNAGLIGMSKEHLAIALALGVPIVVCITKVHIHPSADTETIKQVVKILKSPGCRKNPVFVKSIETAVEISAAFGKDRLCPIFLLSNVTGEGLDFVRTFLNLLPSSETDPEKFPVDQPLEFCVTEIWSVPYVGKASRNVHSICSFILAGSVVNGIINSGVIKTGDAILFGPDANGNFQPTSVRSMQRKRADITRAEAGQCVSLALKRVRRNAIRKGMVIVHRDFQPKAVRQFEGQVLILYHNTTLQKNYQAMLHCGAVRQTVRIIDMDAEHLRTGDRARVTFEFLSHPEFIKEGQKLLFREGKTKGLGVISRIIG